MSDRYIRIFGAIIAALEAISTVYFGYAFGIYLVLLCGYIIHL
jgi:hypothetical protein